MNNFNDYQYYSQLKPYEQPITNEPNYAQNTNLNIDLDIDTFFATLPSLEELNTIETQLVYQEDVREELVLPIEPIAISTNPKPDIFCSVCGNKSSGFHYGSFTCEACKLFFRRAEKQIRKTGFNECKTKNCTIKYENRANCSECRYKKCIAVGMAMSRSRFGRHTNQLESTYCPNLSETLIGLMQNLNNTCLNSNIDLTILNNLILDFYNKILKVLENVRIDFSLSEFSSLFSQANTIKLPDRKSVV